MHQNCKLGRDGQEPGKSRWSMTPDLSPRWHRGPGGPPPEEAKAVGPKENTAEDPEERAPAAAREGLGLAGAGPQGPLPRNPRMGLDHALSFLDRPVGEGRGVFSYLCKTALGAGPRAMSPAFCFLETKSTLLVCPRVLGGGSTGRCTPPPVPAARLPSF